VAYHFGETKRRLMNKSPNSRINTDPSQRHFVPLARAGYAGRWASRITISLVIEAEMPCTTYCFTTLPPTI
jgi:hypothetical protein